MAFPIVYIILAAILFDIPLNKCVGILLSPFYFIIGLLAVVAGYGLWEMRRWSWYFFIAAQILIAYENAIFALSDSESHHKLAAYLISILLQAIMIHRVAKEVRVPYFFPRIRWWESNPRYRLSAPIRLTRQNNEELEGEILDLSVVGCFIKLRSELKQDESLSLKFKIFGCELQCEGTAVWLATSTVTHPKGAGIKFGFLSKSQKRSLRHIQKRLKKIASFYRRSRYWMSQEDFTKELEAIENKNQEYRFMVYRNRKFQ